MFTYSCETSAQRQAVCLKEKAIKRSTNVFPVSEKNLRILFNGDFGDVLKVKKGLLKKNEHKTPICAHTG